MARILLTRPQEDALRTAERLTALGHAPVIAPVTTVASTGAPCPPGPFAAILLTSANAAPFIGLAGLTGAEVFAVGGRTAAALEAAGARRVRSADGDGTALADLVAAQVEPGARLLHVAGRDRHAEPAASLLARGFDLVVWEVYEAVPAPQLPATAAAALRDGSLDAALHYSRRSAERLLALARTDSVAEALLALAHACLSPAVAEPLTSAGARRLTLAARPDEDSLLDALAAALAAFPPPSQLRDSPVSRSAPDRC